MRIAKTYSRATRCPHYGCYDTSQLNAINITIFTIIFILLIITIQFHLMVVVDDIMHHCASTERKNNFSLSVRLVFFYCRWKQDAISHGTPADRTINDAVQLFLTPLIHHSNLLKSFLTKYRLYAMLWYREFFEDHNYTDYS